MLSTTRTNNWNKSRDEKKTFASLAQRADKGE